MKWIYLLAALILTLCFGLPFSEYNTETLLPLQAVEVEKSPRGVRIVSEVGTGEGRTWEKAVEDLKLRASGEVFFDTAEQVVVCDRSLLPEILESGILRPAAQVYFSEELQDAEGLSAYLSAHESPWTVAMLRGGDQW